MVKVPVKRKQKKVIKQKQKQNVNVKQNVKVVVGEIKKKRAVKSSSAKSGAGAKPPIILNISNPQPYNNPYMMYFKEQLQNQQPIKANTITQFETLNEREENKASRAGALHRLDQEPDDVAREMKIQEERLKSSIRQSEAERKAEERELVGSVKKLPKEPKHQNVSPKIKQPQATPKVQFIQQEEPARITPESMVLQELEEQRARLEREMEKPGGAGEENPPPAEAPQEEEGWTITPKKKRKGRPKGSKNKPKTNQ